MISFSRIGFRDGLYQGNPALYKNLLQDRKALKFRHIGYMKTIIVKGKRSNPIAFGSRKTEKVHGFVVHSHQLTYPFSFLRHQIVGVERYILTESTAP